MKQQTAVEWLVDKVTDMIHESNHIELVSLLEQAKQIEKEQMKIHNKYYPNTDEEWKQDKEQEDWYWEQLDNDFNEISDEEIEKQSKYWNETTNTDMWTFKLAWEAGAKWYREQLKQKL